MSRISSVSSVALFGLLIVGLSLASLPQPAFGGQEAKDVFQASCATCHGPGGKGDGVMTASLPVKPKDFTDCKEMAPVSDDVITKVIKSGGQSAGLSPLMPPFGGALSDQQIRDLVDFIRSFCKK
ncbi:MAG: c-type cytochrome [Candidatus Binatia bacterium]